MGFLDKLLGKGGRAKEKTVARKVGGQEEQEVGSVRFEMNQRIYRMLLAALDSEPAARELKGRVEGAAQQSYTSYAFILPSSEARLLYDTVLDILEKRIGEAKENLRSPIGQMGPMQLREHSKAIYASVQDLQEVVQALVSQMPRELRPKGPPPEVWE